MLIHQVGGGQLENPIGGGQFQWSLQEWWLLRLYFFRKTAEKLDRKKRKPLIAFNLLNFVDNMSYRWTCLPKRT
jgi:hypothetical protein